jgi:putative proteasome-type protease
MTYCVAMSLEAGMLFASDSRTNAGVDQIARFSKMRIIATEGERIIVTLSSGNLSITQNALNTLAERTRARTTRSTCPTPKIDVRYRAAHRRLAA